LSSTSPEGGGQHGQPGGGVPRPRIQTLSDLIFGLALSIGAITLLSQPPADLEDLASTVIGFGWAFTILALVWVRYTRIMSVLPTETGRNVAANMVLLFLVSIEPYFYNLIGVSLGSHPTQLSAGTTTALYAIDMGLIFCILSYFNHEITVEERNLIPRELLRGQRLQRDATVVSAGLFLVSALPPFWGVTVLGIEVRFVLWMGTFVVWAGRRLVEKGRRRGATALASE
jgi:uncharacterized membrane protein